MIMVLLLGVILLLVCSLYLENLPVLKFILEGIAVGIIVAGILGLTIDRLLRQEFAQDAFKASIGYILPEELKGEMEWIYASHILCTEHVQRFEILHIDDETCAVRVHIERKFRNVSGSVEDAELGVAVDEWFHKTGCSKILSVGYIKEGKRSSQEGEEISIEKNETTISVKEEKVTLAPNEEIDTWCEVEEIKRTNDFQSWNFAYPTLNPKVFVKSYEGLGYRVNFGYRKESEQVENDTYRLNGTLLPGQLLSLQWWRVEEVKKWLNK